MDIVVLAGGISTERDVSLSSGAKVCRALREKGHRAVLLDSFFGMAEVPSDIKDVFRLAGDPVDYRVKEEAPDIPAIRASRKEAGLGELGVNVLPICQAADIVYLGLHGENGENGRLQALFDMAGIRYTGSGYLGSALAMNKQLTKDVFLQSGVSTPKSVCLNRGEDEKAVLVLGFPVVVKPCSGGSSVGVTIAKDEAELKEALRDCFSYEEAVLVEEYIAGREFSCGILGDTPLPPIEIIPKGEFYDYAHKYQAGWTEEICPARIDEATTKRMQTIALKGYKALQLQVYARLDFMLTEDGRAYCLEANTLPGMTPTSLLPQAAAAAGIGYDELCEKMVMMAVKR